MMANIIYISPIEEETWTESQSNIISEDEDNRSIKVPSSLYVSASKPTNLFDKFADITMHNVKSI